MKQCSEPSETYPQPEPKRWRTPRRKRRSRTQGGTEDRPPASERSWSSIQRREMPIRERADWVLCKCLYQGRTETVTTQSKSNQGMQPSRKQRSRPKFSGNGWLPGQLHQQLCSHSSTTLSANPKRWEKEEENAFRKIQDTISNDKTMAFFDPSRPIIPRTEASYNQGLSAAQLQKTDKGIQPAHFMSPTMAETEKRYNQTEKDALAIKWAKEQLRVYRLGAPRFRIVATHKPLLPLFNKAKATMSPRIAKMGKGNAGRWLWAGIRA